MKKNALFLSFVIGTLSHAMVLSPSETAQANFVDRGMVLLDADGNEQAVKVGEQNKSPFGVFLALTPKDGSGVMEVNYCTATHLKGQHVLTATHCIPKNSRSTLWIVFYSKEGKKQVYPIYEFFFKGAGEEDIAMVKLPEEAVPLWDDSDFQYKKFEKPGHESDFSVTLWSYTPLIHFPQLQIKYPDSNGMVFRPNYCLASQSLPHIEVRDKKTRKKVGEINFAEKMETKSHLFIDKCKHPILQGNSGSLITHGKNFAYKLGVLHYVLGNHASIWPQLTANGLTTNPKTDLYYHGVDGKTEWLSQEVGSYDIGAGSLFEVIEKRSPAAMPPR